MAKKTDFYAEEEQCSIAMGPMLDCTFLLILYFISVSTISAAKISRKVTLPVAQNALEEKDESSRFVIDIEWDEGMNQASFLANSVPYFDAMDLSPVLQKAARSKPKDFRVIIRGDRRVPYEVTQEVLAAVANANIPNVKFSTLEYSKD